MLQDKTLTAEDAILLLLAANGSGKSDSIVGLTRLNKELFLLEKEGAVKVGVQFEPKYYGPYSREISEAVERLRQGLFVSVAVLETYYSTSVEIYSLTPRGRIRAGRLYETLSPRVKEAVNMIKSKYNTRKLESLLDYVHTTYPQYRLTSY
jgi:hypothetical protein